MIPKTKSDVLIYLEEKIRIEYSPEFLNGIYTFLKDIGLSREVVGLTKDELMERILHIHDLLAIRNPNFPPSLPLDLVYPAFFEYCIYKHTEEYIPSISALVKVFNIWATTTHDIEKLRDRYYSENPAKAPKQLSAEPVKQGKGNIETWTNSEIEKQLNTLLSIYKNDPDAMFVPDGGDGYISRLIAEARKRKIETSFNY